MMTTISDQNISDSRPSTFCSLRGRLCSVNASRMAKSGLVPMSP